MSEEIPKDKPSLRVIKFEPKKNEKVEEAVKGEEVACDEILKNAMGRLSTVVLVGYTKDEYEYYAASVDDCAEIVWLLERMKKFMVEQADGE